MLDNVFIGKCRFLTKFGLSWNDLYSLFKVIKKENRELVIDLLLVACCVKLAVYFCEHIEEFKELMIGYVRNNGYVGPLG